MNLKFYHIKPKKTSLLNRFVIASFGGYRFPYCFNFYKCSSKDLFRSLLPWVTAKFKIPTKL